LHLVGYLYYWQMGFNSVFKGLTYGALQNTDRNVRCFRLSLQFASNIKRECIKQDMEKYTGLNCIKRVSSHKRVRCRWWKQGSETKRNFSIRKINVNPSRSRSMEGQQKRQLTSRIVSLVDFMWMRSISFRHCFTPVSSAKQFIIQMYRKGYLDDYFYISCANSAV